MTKDREDEEKMNEKKELDHGDDIDKYFNYWYVQKTNVLFNNIKPILNWRKTNKQTQNK